MKLTTRPGTIFKRCGCTDPNTGKRLGNACPKLRRANGSWSPRHGTWQYRLELPARPDGRRRTPLRRGGFPTQNDAENDCEQARSLLAIADADDPDTVEKIIDSIHAAITTSGALPDEDDVRRRVHTGQPLTGTPLLGEALEEWLGGKKDISANTRISYESHIRLYLKPYLGTVRRDRLSVAHLNDMFDAIDEHNEVIRAAREPLTIPPGTSSAAARELRRRHQEQRAAVKWQKPVGAASKQRIRATLRVALNDMIAQQMITFNPAAHVKLPSGQRPKPLVWTPKRVARWQATGAVPSPVMVWTPAQTGQFLDAAAGHRLYALFRLLAFRGLRRGEACGLHPDDLDATEHSLTVGRQLLVVNGDALLADPKTDAGVRVVALAADDITAINQHLAQRAADQLAAGPAWSGSELLFTTALGQPLYPPDVSDLFHTIADAAGLPPIRLHDLRHCAATYMLASGADIKIVQETLGHTNYGFTADTYTSVLHDVARDAAEATARYIPHGTSHRSLPPAG